MFHHEDAPHDHRPHGPHHHHTPHHHTHGSVDPSIVATHRGMWAVKVSFLALCATALAQVVIVWLSGSVALLADTIHNAADACTALPLWAAFTLARRPPSPRFTYGYGRVEDLAGMAIVLTIVASALVAGYESIYRLLHPQPVAYLGAVMAASVIGFLGNEAVAVWRMKVGREIGSAALVADGQHARVDGLASLAVLIGALGVWMGYPLADAIVGLLITVVIGGIIWQSSTTVLTRLLDGVDPALIAEITHAAQHAPGVQEVTEVRARWLGHRLHAELNIAVDSTLVVQEGHDIAQEVRHRLLHHLRYLANATIHVDPVQASGEVYHHIDAHIHDAYPLHAH